MDGVGVNAHSYRDNGIRSFGAINGVFGISANVHASGVYGENNGGGWGVAGRTNGANRAGVFGDNTGSGIGVLGASASGIGVQASGTRAPIRLVPSAVPGAPSSGFHEMGEMMVDSNGDLYLCKATGTPGTWKLIG
ncbi:MAG: hypothetical protein ABR606_05650 [Vicinamibacterales bacterium]